MTVLLLGLVGWPPVHMALSSHLGFSPWIYFGWGMYSTPYGPKNQILHVYVLPRTPVEYPAAESESLLAPAHLETTYVVYKWHDGRFETLTSRALARNQSSPVLRLKVLRGTAQVEALGKKIMRRHKLAADTTKMIFLVIQPRIHPLPRVTFAEVDAYLFEENRAKELGAYRSDEADLNEQLLSWMSLRPADLAPSGSLR